MNVNNGTRDVESPPLAAQVIEFWFEGNGANDPVEFAGSIESVTRLTSTGGVPFYRVRFPDVHVDKRQFWTGHANVVADIESGDVDAEARLPTGLSMPATPAASANEIDVVCRLGGANTNSLAATARVCLTIVYDKAIRID